MTSPQTRPLRILTLVGGIRGGAETVARQIVVNLDRTRFEPVLCLTRREPPEIYEWTRREFEQAGIPLLSIGRRSRLELYAWRRLVVYMRRHRVDVLHSHMFGSNCWGALLGPLAGVPVFVAQEHGRPFRGRLHRRLLERQLVARRADAIVTVSREDRRRMHEIEGIPLEKVHFIPNGIPAPDRRFPPIDLRAGLKISPEQPVIGVVATLRPEKALDVVIRAVVPLVERFPGLRLLIAGGEPGRQGELSGPVRERLTGLARQLGVADSVCLLGFRSDVANVLDAVDVGVLCSDSEASPLAVLEYMQAAKPVVATRVGGIPDLVEDGVTGILVEPQDPQGLADAITELLSDSKRAEAMGRVGCERRRREFSIEKTAQRFEVLYEKLYAAKSGVGLRCR